MKYEYDDMNLPWWLVFIAVPLLLIFGIGLMKAEAQPPKFIEPVCDLPFNVEYSRDYTELMFEGKATEYHSTRWFEIRDEWVEIYGGGRIYIGTYNILGQWAVVWITLKDEIYIVMGEDWAIGGDGQLHNPYCSEVLPLKRLSMIDKFPYMVEMR